MASVNKVILVGRVGRDPEITSVHDMRYAKFNIATNSYSKDKNGQKVEHTDWHRISVSDKFLAELAENYVRKGNLVYVEGTLTNKKYIAKDGLEKLSVEICLRPFSGVLIIIESNKREDYQSLDSGNKSQERQSIPAYSARNKEAFSISGVTQRDGDIYDDALSF